MSDSIHGESNVKLSLQCITSKHNGKVIQCHKCQMNFNWVYDLMTVPTNASVHAMQCNVITSQSSKKVPYAPFPMTFAPYISAGSLKQLSRGDLVMLRFVIFTAKRSFSVDFPSQEGDYTSESYDTNLCRERFSSFQRTVLFICPRPRNR